MPTTTPATTPATTPVLLSITQSCRISGYVPQHEVGVVESLGRWLETHPTIARRLISSEDAPALLEIEITATPTTWERGGWRITSEGRVETGSYAIGFAPIVQAAIDEDRIPTSIGPDEVLAHFEQSRVTRAQTIRELARTVTEMTYRINDARRMIRALRLDVDHPDLLPLLDEAEARLAREQREAERQIEEEREVARQADREQQAAEAARQAALDEAHRRHVELALVGCDELTRARYAEGLMSRAEQEQRIKEMIFAPIDDVMAPYVRMTAEDVCAEHADDHEVGFDKWTLQFVTDAQYLALVQLRKIALAPSPITVTYTTRTHRGTCSVSGCGACKIRHGILITVQWEGIEYTHEVELPQVTP